MNYKKALILQAEKTLSTEAKGKPLCVLADTSYSMTATCDAGTSCFHEMQRALAVALKGRKDYSLVTFSDEIHVAKSPEVMDFDRGVATALGAALTAVAKQKPEHLLIVTDGEPSDDWQTPLDTLFPWVRVDVLFVGSRKDKSAIATCEAIARCGGEVMVTTKDYLGGIKYLLGEGAGK